MIDGKRVAALVPARAGSKGLPGKNTLAIGGRPLVAWTILAALDSGFVDDVIVTSDNPFVLDLAAGFGACPLTRPPGLATDHSPTSHVIRHAIGHRQDLEIAVLLQPTSPLRTARHIDAALTLLLECPEKAIVSVCETPVNPEMLFRLDLDGGLQALVNTDETRRQDLPKTYVLNGAIYAAFFEPLANVDFHFGSLGKAPYIMPREASIDIDNAEDFQEAKRLMEMRLDA